MILILVVLVFQKYQSYQQSKAFKAAQLIEQQKQIIEEQRKAIGDLPELKLSEKTQRALELHHSESIQTTQPVVTTNTQYSCDGRTHCSQMHSYEEALFFLRNCPNTQMDGNNDGEPCERQFGR